MQIFYKLIKGNYTLEGNSYISYGIAAYKYDERKKKRVKLLYIEDITLNKKKLMRLVKDCNDLELSLIHIYDVVEDFLCN